MIILVYFHDLPHSLHRDGLKNVLSATYANAESTGRKKNKK